MARTAPVTRTARARRCARLATTTPHAWALVAPAVALGPLASYRSLELLTRCAGQSPAARIATNTLPPLAMLGTSLLLWRRVPPLPERVPAAVPLPQSSRPAAGGAGSRARAVALGLLLGAVLALMNLLLILAQATGARCVATVDAEGATLVIHVLVLAPIAEELAFRGLIYRIFRQTLRPPGATLLSALIFALMHMQLGKAVWAFVLGLIVAPAYEQIRSLLTPMLMHASFNAVPIAMALLRARPDDGGLIWLALAALALAFSLSARRAGRAPEE